MRQLVAVEPDLVPALSSTSSVYQRGLSSFPTRRSSDLDLIPRPEGGGGEGGSKASNTGEGEDDFSFTISQEEFLNFMRSEEHTSELQSRENLVCRLLLEKKKTIKRAD